MRSNETRRGSALVVSLIAIVTLAAMGAAFLRITTSLRSRQTDDVENMKAFYLAEAGLAEGFQAVRMGRTGQVGSEAAPATYGDGLLWVDATATVDEQVRLESTALVGRGRASLAYVVEPVEVPLGFFGDEALVAESVLLVDGYDSTEATYAQAVAAANPLPDLKTYADWLKKTVGVGAFRSVVEGAVIDPNQTYTKKGTELIEGGFEKLTQRELEELVVMQPALRAGYPQGYDPSGPYGTQLAYTDDSAPIGVTTSAIAANTGAGGLLGSNGDVVFQAASDEPVEVYGDVTPGPSGSILGAASVGVSGSTQSRALTVDLPEVVVPTLALESPVRHADLLPLLVPAGAVGYERIEVAADAELILQGPSTVVIGTLVLEPGATLSLDTRAGDVSLFITAEMDLQPGSLVTTSEDPTEATIQVPAIANGAFGAPIRLDATAAFHGAIYAPLTDVRIGGDFEVFGGVIAKRLEIGAGARLHFDNAGFESSPIPRIVSWRIVEIPSAVRGGRNPRQILGIAGGTLEPLAEAHDLTAVWLSIDYLNLSGMLSTYDGTEDGFNWDNVSKVVKVERDPTREQEGPGEDQPVVEDPVEEALTSEEQALVDLINSPLTSRALKRELITLSPLTDPVLGAAIARDPPMDHPDLKQVLLKNSPLSEATLLDTISEPDFFEGSLKYVLLGNSPLSPAELEATLTREPPLGDNDLNEVLAAQ